MPPIQQQQTSRTGLITALVISIVFALGFLIWAFMSNADLNKAQQAFESQKAKYDKVIGAGSLGDLSNHQAQFSPDPDKPRSIDYAGTVSLLHRWVPDARDRRAIGESGYRFYLGS